MARRCAHGWSALISGRSPESKPKEHRPSRLAACYCATWTAAFAQAHMFILRWRRPQIYRPASACPIARVLLDTNDAALYTLIVLPDSRCSRWSSSGNKRGYDVSSVWTVKKNYNILVLRRYYWRRRGLAIQLPFSRSFCKTLTNQRCVVKWPPCKLVFADVKLNCAVVAHSLIDTGAMARWFILRRLCNFSFQPELEHSTQRSKNSSILVANAL